MHNTLWVDILSSDKVVLTIPVSTNLACLNISRNRIRDAIKLVLFSELWKKIAVNGWNAHYDIFVSVKYAGLIIRYGFNVPASLAIEIREDVTREIMNKTAEIENHLSFVITHMNKK